MAAPDWAPTPDQVAEIVRTYTRGTGTGATRAMEQGRWTESTRPTVTAVKGLIETACGDVLSAFQGRGPCTDGLRASSKSAATYKAAQLVCISYFTESTRGDGNAFSALKDMYDGVIGNTAKGVIANCPFTPGEEPAEDAGSLPPAGRGRNPRYPVMGFGDAW